MRYSAILGALFLFMLGYLGHHEWHGGEIAIANFLVSVFTGGHVTG